MRLGEIAEAVGGTLSGSGDVVITGAASAAEAAAGDIVLAENERYLGDAERSDASAIVAARAIRCGKPAILVDDPRWAFAQVLRLLAPEEKRPAPGIDPSCRVGERLQCGRDVSIGYGCCIGDDVTIGDGAVIYPLVYIGDEVKIGAGSVIHPNVTIYARCELGSQVAVHAGTVIGSDGFGYVAVGGEIHKVPQIGTVVVEDDVEIGANVAIDRAKTGATRIGRGTKIDNLVQIAHNVKTGEMCLIVAQVGISGSVELGDRVTLAGQVGVKDHVRIGEGAVVGGQAGVFGDLPGGEVYSGYPARPHRESLRAQAAALRFPDTLKAIERLEEEVRGLKKRLERLDGDGSGS